MEKAIKHYLKRKGYNGNCVNNLTIDKTKQVYELYIENKEPDNIMSGIHGFFAVYYYETKQYNKMIECNKIQISINNHDEGAIKNLAIHIKEQNNDVLIADIFKYFNDKNMPNVVTQLKNHISENFIISHNIQINLVKSSKSSKPSKSLKNKTTTNTNTNTNTSTPIINNKLDILINNYKINNNPSEIYDLYNTCIDNNIKKVYLHKLVIIKNFIPSKEMVNDMLTLDFYNNSPLEIKLFKSIFNGCTVNNLAQNFNPSAIQNAIDANNFTEIHELYNQCPNEIFKKMYLTKIMVIKDFKPSSIMINDTINLDFGNDTPLEIKVFKSIFGGYKI